MQVVLTTDDASAKGTLDTEKRSSPKTTATHQTFESC